MSEPKRLYKRKWLNKKSGLAVAEVTCSAETSKSTGSVSLYADLTLRDCSRQINLEFSVWPAKNAEHTLKAYKEKLKKIDRLRKAIDQMERFMLDNPPVYGSRKPVGRKSVEVEGLGTVHVPEALEGFLGDQEGGGDEEE